MGHEGEHAVMGRRMHVFSEIPVDMAGERVELNLSNIPEEVAGVLEDLVLPGQVFIQLKDAGLAAVVCRIRVKR